MEFPVTVESQADFDKLVSDRIKRERDKFADYPTIKEQLAAAELAKTTAEAAAEAANTRAEAAESWKSDREAGDALAAVRSDVAKAAGVPETALRGSSKEELEAHAAELKPLLTAQQTPVLTNPGQTPDKPLDSNNEELAAVRGLFGGGSEE